MISEVLFEARLCWPQGVVEEYCEPECPDQLQRDRHENDGDENAKESPDNLIMVEVLLELHRYTNGRPIKDSLAAVVETLFPTVESAVQNHALHPLLDGLDLLGDRIPLEVHEFEGDDEDSQDDDSREH